MKRLIAVTAILLLISSSGFGLGDYGTPGEFLNWGAGARSMGMGRAFTGLADDASAIYYNPAGLAFQNPLQIMGQHVFLFYDTIYEYGAIVYPVSGIGTFGFGYVGLMSFGYDARDDEWVSLSPDPFNIMNQAFMLSYARELIPWLSLGLNVKVIAESNFGADSIGYGADVGLLAVPNEYISVGLSVINAVPPTIKLDVDDEQFPIIVKFGLALKLFGDRVIPSVDVEKELSNKDVKVRFGAELWPVQQVAIRGGMDETEMMVGLGVAWKPYYIDYSLSFQELGLSHRVSVTFAFGGFDVNLSAEPKIFSPVGVRKNTTISIYAVTKYQISEWELSILNEEGDSVRTYSGDEKPPTQVIWNGKDDRGLPVSDGEYRCVMKVIDKNGKEISSGGETVKISSSIPMQPGRIELEE